MYVSDSPAQHCLVLVEKVRGMVYYTRAFHISWTCCPKWREVHDRPGTVLCAYYLLYNWSIVSCILIWMLYAVYQYYINYSSKPGILSVNRLPMGVAQKCAVRVTTSRAHARQEVSVAGRK